MIRAFLVGILCLGSLTPTRGQAKDKDAKHETFTISPRFAVWSAAVSSDGKRVIYGVGDMTLRIWDIAKGEEVLKWEGHKHPAIHRAVFSPNGKQAFSCCEDGTILQWDAATGNQTRLIQGKAIGVKSIDIDPAGKRLISGGSEGKLRLFDLENLELLKTMTIEDGIVSSPFRSVAFAPSKDQALAGNAKGYVSLWDLKAGNMQKLFKGQQGEVTSVAFLPDGNSFVACSDSDNDFRLWNIATTKVTQTFNGHIGPVASLAVLADGARVVSGSADGTVRVWDLKSGKELQKLEEHSKKVTSVAVAPGGRIISCDDGGTVIVWQIR